ncbi:DUF6191 domain-containing protein [Streptomyces mirabilis]|uniref:DUF6191 domain-containing protein n=1 Tax=Streptomyces mirabilis TaxID=68239 RepID=UPI0036A231AA
MRGFRGRRVLRSRRGPARRPLTGSAFDEFGLMFNGNKSIEIEQQQQDEGRREEEGDGAPPRTRIDLASGTARIVLLPAGGTTGPRSAAPSGAGRESESGVGTVRGRSHPRSSPRRSGRLSLAGDRACRACSANPFGPSAGPCKKCHCKDFRVIVW